jgi:hypothetical protein
MTPLLPRFYRRQQEAEASASVAEAVNESIADETFTPRSSITKPGDHRRLRGIPCIARGVSGVQAGSDPVAELIRGWGR